MNHMPPHAPRWSLDLVSFVHENSHINNKRDRDENLKRAVRKLFEVFDLDKSGFLTMDEALACTRAMRTKEADENSGIGDPAQVVLNRKHAKTVSQVFGQCETEMGMRAPVLFDVCFDEKKAVKMFEALDQNSDGKVPLKEYTDYICSKVRHSSLVVDDVVVFLDRAREKLEAALDWKRRKQQLLDVFGSWDDNNDGHLDRDELASLLVALGIDGDTAAWVMKEMDVNSDGDIEFAEFLDFLYDNPEFEFAPKQAGS